MPPIVEASLRSSIDTPLSAQAQSELSRFRDLAKGGGENKQVNFGLPSRSFEAAEELKIAGLMTTDTNPEGETMMYPTPNGRERILAGLEFKSRLTARDSIEMEPQLKLQLLEAASILQYVSAKPEPGITRQLRVIEYPHGDYGIIEERILNQRNDKYANRGTERTFCFDGKTGELKSAHTSNLNYMGLNRDFEDELLDIAKHTANNLLWEIEPKYRDYLGKPERLEELRREKRENDEDDAIEAMQRREEEED